MGSPPPSETTGVLEYDQLRELLPYRWPFLLLDRAIKIEPGVSATCLKCVSGTESFFLGHFPGKAVMPGVLVLEAIAQCLLVAVLTGLPAGRPAPTFLLGRIKDVRFRRPVRPGDRLEIVAVVEKFLGGMGLGRGTAHVDGELVVSADIGFGVEGG